MLQMTTHYKLIALLLAVTSWSLGALSAQNYIMNGNPINDCSGFFLDSGGNSGGYGPNQNITTTICPDGSTGTHIQLFFISLALGTGDELCFYDSPVAVPGNELSCASDFFTGPPFIVQATAANPGGCLTVVFTSDGTDEGAGWSAQIGCIAACQTILSDLVSSTPVVAPADTGWINACPEQRIYFNGQGLYPQNGLIYNHSDFTSSFEWNFGDGVTAVGPNVSHTYDEPGGYVVQLIITDQFGCRSSTFLNQRVRISTRPDFIIGGTLPAQICAGDTISLDASINTMQNASEVSVIPLPGSFQSGGTVSDSLPLPDGTGAVYETSVNLTSFSPGQVLTDINDLTSICVNMEHSWMHDLDVLLRCPDGTTVILQNQEFIGNLVFLGQPYELDDFTNPNPPLPGVGWDYCWTASAQYTWTEYTQTFDPPTLPSGDYASFDPLDNLVGCPLNGEWTLIVQDQWASDNGWVFEWSINFNPAIYPELEVFTPQIVDYTWLSNPSVFFLSQDSISASPQNAGTASYIFSVTNDYGCTYDTSLQLVVLPETHPDCYDCQQLLAPEDDIVICENDNAPLDVNANLPLQTAVTFEAYPNYPLGFSNHPYANPYYSSMNVNSIRPLTISNVSNQIVSVCVNISTDWNSDLRLYLRAPSGQLLELSTNNGGSSDNYTNTCFTTAAAPLINTGTGPFTGNFRPEGNWTVLNGATINGIWQLVVSDGFGINEMGAINSWSITFNSTNVITYNWSPAAGLSCTNCPNPVADPNNTTSYIVQASDSYGCTARDTIVVGIINNLPAPVVICQPTADGEITFSWSPIGGINDYEIRYTLNGVTGPWQGPISDQVYVVNGLQVGDQVTLEVRANTGGASLNCVVDVGTATCDYGACTLAGSANNLQPSSCFGVADGAATIVAAGGTSPYQFYLDGSPTSTFNGAYSNLSPGNHFVIVQDIDGCRDSVFFSIQQPTQLTLGLNITQAVSCFNGNNGVVTATPQGGNGGYSYTWNGVSSGANNVRSNLAPNTYQVVVTDSEGCTANSSINLANPAQLMLSIDSQDPNCFNTQDGQALAVASGGTGQLNYSWTSGAQQALAANLAAGNQCVTVTDASGCTISDCVNLVAPPPLVITSITSTPVDCNGNNTGSAMVSASGGAAGFSYQWDDALQQLSSLALFLEAGTYTAQVTDANGCSVTGSVEVLEPASLALNVNTIAALCFDGADGQATAVVSGGVNPYTYHWNNNAATPTINGLTAGTYAITVTDNNGCEIQSSANVSEPATPVSVVVAQSFRSCFGEGNNAATAIASGGTGNFYTYAWSNQQAGATASALAPGAYSVTATDLNGCAADTSITLDDWPAFGANIIANQPTCFGYNDGEMGINQFSGGAGLPNEISDYTFLWSNGQGGLTAQGLAGNTSYTVTITDQQGCFGVISRFLPQPSLITFEIDPAAVSCFEGADGTATVTNILGDVGGYTFRWDSNAGGQTGSTATGLAAGAYSVTVTDVNGCFNSNSVQVDQPPVLAVKLEAEDNKCYGGNAGEITSLITGGVPGYTYQWSNQQTGASLSGLIAGDYQVTITDANGCEATSNIEIEQPDQLTATLSPTNADCFGFKDGSIQVAPQGGTPPYQYSLNNQTWSGSSTLIGLAAGNYTVYVQDIYNCTFFDDISISEPAEFSVDAGPDIHITLGDSIRLLANAFNNNGPVTFTWSEPYEGTLSCTICPDPQVNIQYTISYELYGVDANGCDDTDIIHIFVDKPRIVAVPTGFSPNGDNLNDRLLVHGQEGTQIELFQVFDRWGELIYEGRNFPANDPNAGWDGSFKGEMLNSGVYIWFVRAVYIDGERETFKGETTLIR